ncbi:MAG: IS256 family transposase ISPaac1 [Chlamydiales bacterium]|nr:IS256 family transposase ISPaac1 [Chlamydiales bacterium]
MKQDHIFPDFSTSLEAILKQGAQKLLQQAIENELTEYLQQHQSRGADNRKIVRRNGYLPERSIQTGIGSISIKQPRVRGDNYSSVILPKYLRRVPSLEALIPALYLKGVSTGNMEEALAAILGKNASGLSPTNIVRLKAMWEQEYEKWTKRDLSYKHYVYIWADGIYFNVRLSEERPCLLVLIGARLDGTKELLAIHDGIRESTLSWKEVLLDLKARGLTTSPWLAIGDGALGFWAALEEEMPSCGQQRCWVHKTANILDKLPKSAQAGAKTLIHEMYMSPTKAEGLKIFDRFVSLYEAKYPKACNCLTKSKEQLFTFYDFPAEHWQHIRTTNPIESMFASIRHRSRQTKGCGSRKATLFMVFKLSMEAEKKWRRLRGSVLISKVVSGVKFKDGQEVEQAA